MSTGASNGPRLSADDWIEAGYAILAEGGLDALKLDRLCTRLGVTKGSFYWHFTDMAGYRAALLMAWAQLHDRARSAFVASVGFLQLSSGPPDRRSAARREQFLDLMLRP